MATLTPAQLVARVGAHDTHLRIAVASDSESGKSSLVLELARALRAAGLVTVVCALTADVAGAEEQYGAVLTAGCNLLWSEGALESMLALKAKRKEEGKPNPPTLIILDDLAGEKAGNSDAINTLYTRGRHYNLVPIFINQVANTELSPKVRGNCNLFFFSSLTRSGVGILYETFVLSPPLSKKELTDWMSDLPRYTFGAYDRIEKCLIRVKADLSGADSGSDGESVRSGVERVRRSSIASAETKEERLDRRGKQQAELAAVKAELQRYKSVMSFIRIRAQSAMYLLEEVAHDDEVKMAIGIVLRSFEPDGSLKVSVSHEVPASIPTRTNIGWRWAAKKKQEVSFEENVLPRAGAGLSEEDALAARFGEAASLDEL